MAKDAMGNAALFAAVLKIPQLEEVIRGLDTLLVACNSGGFINVPKFRDECEDILQTLYDDIDLAWNMTNPTVCIKLKSSSIINLSLTDKDLLQVHFFLEHSPDIIAYFQGFGVKISETSEEGRN